MLEQIHVKAQLETDGPSVLTAPDVFSGSFALGCNPNIVSKKLHIKFKFQLKNEIWHISCILRFSRALKKDRKDRKEET